MEIEDNLKNPEIGIPNKIKIAHYFIIKYTNDDIRIYFSNLVNKLIKKHELHNFHIEEKKAYLENKILYNYHILIKDNTNFEELDTMFLRYLIN